MAVDHIGLSDTDAFLLCAQTVFGKPVIRDDYPPATPYASIPCPLPNSDEFLERLKEAGVTAFQAQGAVFLLASWRLTGAGTLPAVKWKQVSIVPRVKDWRPEADRRASEAEKIEIAAAILGSARTIPLFAPYEVDQGGPKAASPAGESLIMELPLWVDILGTGVSRPESVISIMGAGDAGGEARLVYGEFHEGHFRVHWDSPLFYAWNLRTLYADMDGDGVPEILLLSSYGSASNPGTTVTAFDLEGRELTRQKPCALLELEPFGEQGSVCPLAADEIRVTNDGKQNLLLVTGRREDQGTKREGRSYVYRLVRGHFVARPVDGRRNQPSL